MTAPHIIETPRPDRYAARPLAVDGVQVTNAVPVEWTVATAGLKTLFVRISSAVNGSLEIRLRRTNKTEYPVALGPANTAITGGTPAEVSVAVKGAKEVQVRFVPAATGTLNWLDIGPEVL